MRRRIDGARKALLVLDVNHGDPGSLSLAANNSNAATTGASSMFILDAIFIRAATSPPRLGEASHGFRGGKVSPFPRRVPRLLL